MESLIKVQNDKEDLSLVSSTLQTIVIPVEVYNELISYTQHYDTEVSGCGMVEREEVKRFVGERTKTLIHTVNYRITEVFLPPKQKNSWSSTEISEETIAELIGNLIEQERDVSKLKMHWHSHVNMNTFHSGTDVENYAGLDNGDFLVSLVINKRKEILGRVDIYNSVIVAFINVPTFISVEVPEGITGKVEANLKALDEYIAAEKEKNTVGYGNTYQYEFEKEKKNNSKVGNITGLLPLVNNGIINYTEIKRRAKIRKKLRRQMNLSDTTALKYETCTQAQHTCNFCQDAEVCSKYNDELLERQYGK